VAVLDNRGRLLLRARVSEISQHGLYCLTLARRGLHIKGKVLVEVYLPTGRPGTVRRTPTRTVRYLSRIVRSEEIGQLVGLAIEFLEKLD